MKTIIFVLALSFLSVSVWAQDDEKCIASLTKNYSQDLTVFRLDSDDIDEYDQFNPESAIHVVDVLLQKETPCTIKDVKDTQFRSECKSFGSNTVCEVRTSIGYFLVHRGSFGHFVHSVVFGRWD